MTDNDQHKPTLADALIALLEAPLTDIQKRDTRSAVMTFCKALGLSPDEVPASPIYIRRKLEGISYVALGYSKGRWSNVKTGVARAVGLVGKSYPSRNTTPLLPQWAALLTMLPASLKRKVWACARYLSGLGVDADAVSLNDLHSYRDTILNDRMRANAEQAWDHFLWGWNRAVDQFPDIWPQITIPRVEKREVYVYPFAYFPASFEADVNAYADRMRNVNLDDDGPLRPSRPATIATRTRQLRTAASVLARSGVDPATITGIARLVEVDNFKLILHFHMERAGGKTSAGVAQIASCLRNIARHYVKVDEEHDRKMSALCKRVSVQTGGLTAKNRERLRPFDDTEHVRLFLCLPDTIRQQVERDKRAPAQKAVLAQVAAAIALLLATPIRNANLCAIDIHRHLKPQRKEVHLVISESETKNRNPVDFNIPPYALEILRWYMTEYRPYLVREPTDALFPGRNGKHKTAHTLGVQIKDTVFEFTGHTFNVHLFRHFAGKVFLDQQPGNYEVVRQVLGHKRLDTTTSFYSGAEAKRASAMFNNVVDTLRAQHAPIASKRRSDK
ncbi:tyrosine-type recombinase/integrase [Sphingorhabdus sp.]|jgi:site-specific recombinase XerD|uniref:tyrosine-type recombinase/integrase n=1 Tax=Sphingorhabdus sp. TaxID=1902408 RepID=UPI0037C795FF